MARTRFISFSSTYGPFLRLRLIGGGPWSRGREVERSRRLVDSGPSTSRLLDLLARYSLCALPHDELVRRLTVASLLAHGHLAPLRLRLAADRRLALAAAVRVVARVHGRAADRGSEAEVPRAAGLAQADRGVRPVPDLAQRGCALGMGQPHL